MCDLVIPENLNNDLLENALFNALGEKSVKVLSFRTKPAAASGDNYTSDVYRVLVEYQTKNSKPKQISLIVKYMLESEAIVEALDEYKLFIKEKEIYLNFLPKISTMLNENFGPKCYYILEEPSKVFVLEDLKDSGFTLLDRQDGLDLDHCLLLVEKMAKYHATSMVFADQEPEMMEIFDFGIINTGAKDKSRIIPPHTLPALAALIEEASDWPGFEKIVQKLKIIMECFEEKSIRCINQESSFKVLNHGDLWTNNFMVTYDENKQPNDVYFIDYQIGFYTSMGIDWNYFMTLGANNTVKIQNRDLLLETYYTTLTKVLENFGYSRAKFPTMKDVQDEVANYEFYGFFATICCLPLILMDRDTGVVSDMENLQEGKGEELRRVQFKGKIFQETVKILLKRFNDIGALD